MHRGYFVSFSAKAWGRRSDRTSAATFLDSLATNLPHFPLPDLRPHHLPDHQLLSIPDQLRAAGADSAAQVGRVFCKSSRSLFLD